MKPYHSRIFYLRTVFAFALIGFAMYLLIISVHGDASSFIGFATGITIIEGYLVLGYNYTLQYIGITGMGVAFLVIGVALLFYASAREGGQ
ncbi:MAG: hypothetical protein ACYDAO_00750 [Thermoplasmataceae archaeon]